MSDSLLRPYTYWVGMETDPRTTPEALADFNRFYDTTHVHEVIAAHPGFDSVTRYELVEDDPRGVEHHGPRWLAIYGMVDEAAAERYVKDNARPWLHRRKYSPWPAARRKAKTIWRLLWRRESGDVPTDDLVLVGTNETPSTPPDVLLALYRDFGHPPPGSPRYCGVYGPSGAPAASDEDVWRLTFRRLTMAAE